MTVFCVDYYEGTKTACVGGNSLNFAMQCRGSALGRVSVLGAVGNDGNGELIKKYLARNRFDLTHIVTASGRTASNRIYINENGDRYFKGDSWDGGVFETFRLSKSDWDFVRSHDVLAMPATDPNLPAALTQKKPENRLVVDFLDKRDYDFIREILKETSIGFVSGDEETVETLMPFSLQRDTVIVVTMGACGSVALHKGKSYRAQACPAEKIIDTTGCGDAYQAAFTVSWFNRPDIDLAMHKGSAASARVLTHIGGADQAAGGE
jgi:Sugar kinases, ribokinase family